MAGCGANSTAEAIELARYAKKVGADCTLQVVPYYNKPTQEGMYRHFKAIAEAVRPADGAVQRARPHGGRHAARHRAAAGRRCPASSASRKPPATSSAPQWLIRDAPKGFVDLLRRRPDRRRADAAAAATATSASPPTSRRALMHELCVAAIAGDAQRAMRDPAASCCRCTSTCSSSRTRSPSSGRWRAWACCGAALRLPMTPLTRGRPGGGRAGAARQPACCEAAAPRCSARGPAPGADPIRRLLT